jgi:hypothetical protein
VLYDTRASVYEALSCSNYALYDALKTIEIAPTQWQGYHRSARLLASQGQRDSALKMCTMALGNLGSGTQDDSRRRELTELRQRLEAVPPPPCHISSVPVELLVTIFMLSNNPAVISHVCYEWRAIAHSQPALWRNLVLTAGPNGGGGVQVFRKIDEWHRRSSGWITELHIRKSLGTVLFPTGDGGRRYPSRMYDDVVAALRRLDLTKLKECHTQDVDTGLFLPALGGNDDGLNNLERLSSWCECPHYLLTNQDWFGCSTLSWQSLRSLRLADVQCNWAELSTSMCYLTSFEYDYHDDDGNFRDFHQFLRANASTLEKLVVACPLRTPRLSNTPPEPLNMAHLRHLELKNVIPFHISHGNFTLPSLRILRFLWLKQTTFILSILLEDRGTSFAELLEFTTEGDHLEPQILSAVLLRAPKLKILRCTKFDSVAVVAESLSKPCTAPLRDPSTQLVIPVPLPVLCPALSVLDLSWSSLLKADQVVRIIKERIALAASDERDGRYQLPGVDGDDQRVSRIQTLALNGCPQIEDTLPWFEENVPEFSFWFSCRYPRD